MDFVVKVGGFENVTTHLILRITSTFKSVSYPHWLKHHNGDRHKGEWCCLEFI